MILTVLFGIFNRGDVIGQKGCIIWVSLIGCFGGWVYGLEYVYLINW